MRNLGVLLDSELTMKQHVNKVTSACFYHLRRLRQLKRHVSRDTLRQLVSAFILNRLDYCNSDITLAAHLLPDTVQDRATDVHCTMHSLAGVRSTSRTSWHLLSVTPGDSNYDQPPDPTSLFLVAEQSSAVVPCQ